MIYIGETGVSWNVFRKCAPKTKEKLISAMIDISVKRKTPMLLIQSIKMFGPVMIILKICHKHDHVKRAN